MKPRYVLQYVAVPKAYLQLGLAALRHHAQGLLCEKRRNRDHPVNSGTLRLRYPLPNGRSIPRKLQKVFPPNYRHAGELSTCGFCSRGPATGKRNEHRSQLNA